MVCGVLLVQPLLYWIHHSRNHNHGDKTYGILHRVIGQMTILAGAVNTAIGLHYAKAGILFFVFWGVAGLSFAIWAITRCRARKERSPS